MNICLIYDNYYDTFYSSGTRLSRLGAVFGTRRQYIAFLIHILAEEPVVGITVRIHAR